MDDQSYVATPASSWQTELALFLKALTALVVKATEQMGKG
jgi:hypothetical protein